MLTLKEHTEQSSRNCSTRTPMASLTLFGWAPSYQALSEGSRPGHVKEEKQQLHAMTCGWNRQDSTKHYL